MKVILKNYTAVSSDASLRLDGKNINVSSKLTTLFGRNVVTFTDVASNKSLSVDADSILYVDSEDSALTIQ